MSEVINIPVSVTLSAVEEIRNLRTNMQVPEHVHLRIGVKGGGCAGFSYILGFDEAKENDNQFEVEGLNIIVDKSQEIYLYGTELDFKSGLENRGFIFNNPNAEETCGCGSSFKA